MLASIPCNGTIEPHVESIASKCMPVVKLVVGFLTLCPVMSHGTTCKKYKQYTQAKGSNVRQKRSIFT